MSIEKKRKQTVYLLFSILTAIILAFAPCFASNLDETGDWNRLVTSNYKDGFMTVETSGDNIKVSGVFKEDFPKKIAVVGVDSEKEELHVGDDGTFSGEIICKPMENSYYRLHIIFNSRLIYSYYLKYNGGWSIPDNGIAEENKKKFMNIVSAPPIAAAYYLSADGDRTEVEETLSELQRIVDEVCGDETDDYIKAMRLIDWIGENIYYDHDAADTSVTMDTVAIHNVLERRRTTCAGYANTFSALLEIAGIRSVNLKGAAVAGEITYEMLPTGTENHEFSAFWYKDEKRWVYCDPCWTSNSTYENGEYNHLISGKTKQFDVTGEAFALSHRIDKVEERLYTKALAALDGELDENGAETETTVSEETVMSEESTVSEETVVSKETTVSEEPNASEIKQTETSESAVETTVETTPEITSAENTNINKKNENNESVGNEKQKKNDLNPTLYIIIALIGIAVIGAGIILAVKNRKK